MNIVEMILYILSYFDMFLLKVKLILGAFCKYQTFMGVIHNASSHISMCKIL